jgi:hypothetical protein
VRAVPHSVPSEERSGGREQNELGQLLVLSASDVGGAGRSRSGRAERSGSSACSCPGRVSSTLVDRAKVLGFSSRDSGSDVRGVADGGWK